jgi:hypothetical protein
MQTSRRMVLGIIAESRYAWTTDFQSFAGLGLAFDAETIAETIELFYTRTPFDGIMVGRSTARL